jgi:hypothetical protein
LAVELKKVNKKQKPFKMIIWVVQRQKKMKNLPFTGHRIQPSESPVYKGREVLTVNIAPSTPMSLAQFRLTTSYVNTILP